MSKFIIEARDIAYQRLGLVENYTNFEAIIRYNAVGTWTFTVPAHAPEVELLTTGGGIVVRVEGQDEVAFSGPITKISRTWGEGEEGLGTVVVSGVTDEQILFERVTYPVPTAGLDGQTNDRYIVISNAGTLMELLVLENCGIDALPDRQYPELDVMPGTGLGAPATVSTRFDVLGEKIQEIANASGLGFRVRQGDDNRLKFEMFTPQDKSDLIFGREYGNLLAYAYDIEAPTATRLIFACQGEGKDRYFTGRKFDPYLVETVDDRDSRIIFNGGRTLVSDSDAFRGTLTEIENADAHLDFFGTGVRVYGQNDTGDILDNFYSIDGVADQLDIPPDLPPRSLLLEVNNLPFGKHRLTLAAAEGITFDYFEILDERNVGDWRRRSERFYDRRDIPVAWNADHDELIDPGETDSGGIPLPADPSVYVPMLDQATLEAWEENGPKASLRMSPIDTESIRYGRDYRVGDVVTVEIDGTSFADVLREVRLSDGDEGPRIVPLLGDSQATSTPSIYKTVRRLWSKVRRLEAQ